MRFLAALALLLVASPALADDAEPAKCTQDGAPAKVRVERRGGKNIAVIENDIVVCGHPPRPSVAYVVTAKTINYEWESLKQEFLPKILASVKKAPF
jgi:hypothetical protein